MYKPLGDSLQLRLLSELLSNFPLTGKRNHTLYRFLIDNVLQKVNLAVFEMDHSFSTFKVSRKTNISHPLMRTRTRAYRG